MCQSFPLPRRHRLPLPRRLPHRLLHPRQPLHRFLHLLQSRRLHRQQGHHRLHRRRNPWLRSPQELVVNYTMRDMRRCPGGHVAKPVQCAMLHGNTLIATACCRPWIMPHWCRCWLPGNRSTRLLETTARRTNRRICQLHLCRKFTPRQAYLRRRRRRMRTYGVTRWTGSYMACYKPVLLHRYSNQSTT